MVNGRSDKCCSCLTSNVLLQQVSATEDCHKLTSLLQLHVIQLIWCWEARLAFNAECKDVLIPILIHHHFILVVIEFKLKETRLFDSLKGRQSAVTAHVSRYCEDLERFFNLSDSPVYTHENMSDQITRQGNSYDCGCCTIWNMIRFLQKQRIDCRQKNCIMDSYAGSWCFSWRIHAIWRHFYNNR